MGTGKLVNGKPTPITPWAGSWAATVNQPKSPEPARAGGCNDHEDCAERRQCVRSCRSKALVFGTSPGEYL